MHGLPTRPEDLRRMLTRWVRDTPERYLSFIHRSAAVARRAGKPFHLESDIGVQAASLANAASEMIRRKDVSSLTRRRDVFNKNRARWMAGDTFAPGPDELFGVGDWPSDCSFQVCVKGMGSDRANCDAFIGAAKLAEDYLDHRKELKANATERARHEKLATKLDNFFSEMATRPKTPCGKYIDVSAFVDQEIEAGRDPLASSCSVVPPPPKHSEAHELSNFTNWDTASENQKAASKARVIYEGGQGLSITIDLCQTVVDAAEKVGPSTVSYLRKRFAGLLYRRLGFVPDFILVGEQGYLQAPHLHGAIDLPDTEECRKAVRSAGVVLSGLKVPPKARARIVDIQPLYDPERWIGSYAAKLRGSSKRAFGAKNVIVSTRSLTQRARDRQIGLLAGG